MLEAGGGFLVAEDEKLKVWVQRAAGVLLI